MSTPIADVAIKLSASSNDMVKEMKVGGDAVKGLTAESMKLGMTMGDVSVATDKSLASAQKAAKGWNAETVVVARLRRELEKLQSTLNDQKFDASNVKLVENASGVYGKEIARATVEFKTVQREAQKEFEATLTKLKASLGENPSGQATAQFDQASASAREIRDRKIASARQRQSRVSDAASSAAAREAMIVDLNEAPGSVRAQRAADRSRMMGPAKSKKQAGGDGGGIGSLKDGLDLVRGVGKFAVVGLAAKAFGDLGHSIREASQAAREGKGFAEISETFVQGLPLIGDVYNGLKDIGLAYYDIDPAGAEKLTAEWAKQDAIVVKLRDHQEDLQKSLSDLQFDASAQTYIGAQSTQFGKDNATADVAFSKAQRDAKREYDDAVKKAQEELGGSTDARTTSQFNDTVAEAARLRDAKTDAAFLTMEKARGAAGEQDRQSLTDPLNQMRTQQEQLRGVLRGESDEFSKMRIDIEAIASLSPQQKVDALARFKMEERTTQALRDQVDVMKQQQANRKAIADQIADMNTQLANIGKSDIEVKLDSIAKMPGVGADQVAQYKKALEGLDAKKTGEHLRDQLRTPVDDAKDQLDEIDKALKGNGITADEAEKLRANVTGGLQDLARPQSTTTPADSLIIAGSDAQRGYMDKLAASAAGDKERQKQLVLQTKANELLAQVRDRLAPKPQVVSLAH